MYYYQRGIANLKIDTPDHTEQTQANHKLSSKAEPRPACERLHFKLTGRAATVHSGAGSAGSGQAGKC